MTSCFAESYEQRYQGLLTGLLQDCRPESRCGDGLLGQAFHVWQGIRIDRLVELAAAEKMCLLHWVFPEALAGVISMITPGSAGIEFRGGSPGQDADHPRTKSPGSSVRSVPWTLTPFACTW